MSLERVLGEIAAERARQDEKWGQQDWPLLPGGSGDTYLAQQYAFEADEWRDANEVRPQHEMMAWDGILLEEVYEALAETDPAKARAELVQVAAVAVAMIQSLDRNELRETP